MIPTTNTTIWKIICLLALLPLLLAPPAGVGAPATPAGPRAKELVLDLGDTITMKLVEIPPGTFLMGSPMKEKGRNADEGLAARDVVKGVTQVKVTISKPFYMGIYEVTAGQYRQFAKSDKRPTITVWGASSQYFHQLGGIPQFDWSNKERKPKSEQTSNHPVLKILPADAQQFCEWLSEKTGRKVRLPTEAQWEYAARAGSNSRFSFGDSDNDLHKYGNYCDKSNRGAFPWQDKQHNDGFNYSAPVGSFRPNAWGLYDMHGNAGELCAGIYTDHYSANNTIDPATEVIRPNVRGLYDMQLPVTGPDKPDPAKTFGKYFVFRGGCFAYPPEFCRSAARERRDPWNDPHNSSDFDGFRVIVMQ